MELFLIVTCWRLSLFLLAGIAQTFFTFTPSFPHSDIFLLPSRLPQWIWGWANFDGIHYLSIAKYGYSLQFTKVFFPLYPLLVRIVGLITNDEYYILSGILVSFISYYLSVRTFSSLLHLDYSREKIKWILVFMFVFPTSFYFAAIYTESLFFLLIVSSFLFARQKKWLLSSLCGMLASVTRITGIFILPSLIWEWSHRKINRKLLFKNKETRVESGVYFWERSSRILKVILSCPAVYIVPLGLMMYMAYLYIYFNDPFYFWHAQTIFGAERSGNTLVLPLQVLWRYFKILTSVSTAAYEFKYALWELASFIISVLLLGYAQKKKIRVSYILFGWLVVLIPSLTGTLSSMPRYILGAFVLFIALGLIETKWIKYLILAIFVILLQIFTINFIRGLWVA